MEKHLSPTQRNYLASVHRLRRNTNPFQEQPLYFIDEEIPKVHELVMVGDAENLKKWLDENPEEIELSFRAKTPIIVAIKCDSFECFQILIERKANIEEYNSHKETALVVAVTLQNKRMIDLLLSEGANTRAVDRWQRPVAEMAIDIDNATLLQLLHEKGNDMLELDNANGHYPLANAIDENARRCIEYLLSLKPSALSFPKPSIAGRCYCPIRTIIRENDPETLRKMTELQDFKEMINRPLEDGNTYLHLTVQKKRAKLTEILLQHGADVNAKNQARNTPLHDVIDIETAKLLVKAGANLKAINSYNMTPLQYAYRTSKHGAYHWLSKQVNADKKQEAAAERLTEEEPVSDMDGCMRCKERNLPKQLGRAAKPDALRNNNPKLWNRQFMHP